MKRTCLKCSKQFPSSGPGNRLCRVCTPRRKTIEATSGNLTGRVYRKAGGKD